MFKHFWNKESEVLPETIFKRLDKIENDIRTLKVEVLDTMAAQDALRERIIKRIKPLKEYEKSEEKKDLYNGMLIAE